MGVIDARMMTMLYLRLPGASEADVVGEDGGPVDVAMAVDGVDAVEHGDPEARRQGAALHAVTVGERLISAGHKTC